MALILLGKSSCGLCGYLLLDSETIVALPAIADAIHPLFAYFDQGFHRACFQAWEHRDEALQAVRLDRQRYEESPEYRTLAQPFGKLNQPSGN
jgi:hypothetical protein